MKRPRITAADVRSVRLAMEAREANLRARREGSSVRPMVAIQTRETPTRSKVENDLSLFIVDPCGDEA